MTASGPAEMVRVPGGVVSLGPYQEDPAGLGEREVFLRPYLVERAARGQASPEECALRGGRLPSAAELEHALRLRLVQAVAGAEQTGSFVAPVDAEAVAAIEGVGSFAVLLSGASRMVLARLGSPEGAGPGRCAMLVGGAAVPKGVARTVSARAELRRGRGEGWPVVTSFVALGEAVVVAPRVRVEAGGRVFVHHEDGGWSFVSLFERGEGVGWLPSGLLGAG